MKFYAHRGGAYEAIQAGVIKKLTFMPLHGLVAL